MNWETFIARAAARAKPLPSHGVLWGRLIHEAGIPSLVMGLKPSAEGIPFLDVEYFPERGRGGLRSVIAFPLEA